MRKKGKTEQKKVILFSNKLLLKGQFSLRKISQKMFTKISHVLGRKINLKSQNKSERNKKQKNT